MEDQGRKIFFSYARDDSKFVLKLAEGMRAGGLDLWIDQLDIPSGAHWDQTVEDALKNSPGFLIVLSPKSVASQNVMDEVGFAIERQKRIIPILHQPCEIPFRIRRLQFIDFTGDYDAALAKLLKALNASPVSEANRRPPSSSPLGLFRNRRNLIAVLAIVALGVAGATIAFWNNGSSGCVADRQYPLGRWTIEVLSGTKANYNEYVDFITAKSGTWAGGTFELSAKPAAGEDVTLTYRMPNSNYTSTNLLRVSADGCIMSGQFSDDSKGKDNIHSGTVKYTWQGNRPAAR